MSLTEVETRKKIIDKRLNDAGWNIEDRSQVIKEFDIIIDDILVKEAPTKYAGHQFSDYVLLGKNGKSLAVVEAKKTSVDAAIGREQAKQYCYNILKENSDETPLPLLILINTDNIGKISAFLN